MTTPTIPLTSLHRAHIEPACTAGACQQGKAQCPCPEACRIPDEPRLPISTGRTAYMLIAAGSLLATGVLVAVPELPWLIASLFS
ncbi:hypothetical protein [Pseudorhodoferax sp. Leaf265]|uniref:hypothetical protein n=1 Tax=Pseudorhodoferax sp. Leaf265 TaxID=1736315 RepID=UPI0006FF5DAB|nr:hypothetical protein [Pseudorhodoferax sp. Leaf265]KQP02495.1 hypothetical protein ASF45_20795 [Pseudorhodoferax sp. Leaf265]